MRLEGVRVDLQPKVLDALRLFAENPGRLMTKDELLSRLWPEVIVGEESLTQVVRKLRAALGDDPQEPRYLQTVLKRGYRFLAAVERVEATPPGAASTALPPAASAVEAPAAAAPVAARSTPPARRPALWLGAAALLALVGGLVATWRSAGPAAAGAEAGWRDRRLTVTPEREHFPALSPDGERYAFVRAVGRPLASDLFVAAVDGAPVRLTATPGEEFAPQFSPDGASLVYSVREAGASSVWMMPVLGGPARRLVEDGEWGTWAPDGRRVAFVRREPRGRSSVRARGLDGGDALLWASDGALSAAAWSPDGRAVAAIEGNRVLVGPAAGGGEPVEVGPRFEYVRSLAWETESRALVVDGRLPGAGGNLVRLALDGSPPAALTRGSANLYHPSLSRDGRRLLYAQEHKARQVWRFDGGLRPSEALALPTALECFDLDAAGHRLAATDWSPPPGQSTLALFDLETGERRALGEGLCPAFSPEGRRLAYLGYGAEDRGLWVLDLESGERRRIAEDRGDIGLSEGNAARRPAWSPDGERIAYEGVGLPEGSGIFAVELASGSRRLLAPGVFGNLAWAPDGRVLAASGAGSEGGFALIDAARGGAQKVGEAGAYRASAFFGAAGEVVFLADQTTSPRLLPFDSRSLAPAPPRAVELPVDASFWGLFELVPDRRGGYLGVVERYESDLYLAER